MLNGWFGRGKPSPDEAHRRGIDCAERGDWVIAEEWFRQAVEGDPKASTLWFSLGTAIGQTLSDRAEDEIRVRSAQMRAALVRALMLADEDGGLDDEKYRKACVVASSVLRMEERPDDAVEIIRRGLRRGPEDLELLEGLTRISWEQRDLDAALAGVLQWLELAPDSGEARRLWKKIRRTRGEPPDSDLPMEEKRKVYRLYYGIINGDLQRMEELADRFRAAESIGDMTAALSDSTDRAVEEAKATVAERFGIDAFDLSLILQEGERDAWEKGGGLPAPETPPRRKAFRDGLVCRSCHRRNLASYWPVAGDSVPYFFQTTEDTAEQPGAFRLPVRCAFCGTLWYVVWDESPDPLAGQFLRHIERMREAHCPLEGASDFFLGLVADSLLGKHLEFLRANIGSVLETGRPASDMVIAGGYHTVIHMIPASGHDRVRELMGGSYPTAVDPYIREVDRDRDHFAHWVFCMDDEFTNVHLTIIPKADQAESLPTVLPVDLLTLSERVALGLA